MSAACGSLSILVPSFLFQLVLFLVGGAAYLYFGYYYIYNREETELEQARVESADDNGHDQKESNEDILYYKSKDGKLIKDIAFASTTFYFLASVMHIVGSIFYFEDMCDTGKLVNGELGIGMHLIAFILMIILFSFRLIKTFENTKYNFSNNKVACMKAMDIYILLSILLIGIVIVAGLYQSWMAPFTFINLIITLSYLLTLLYLFVNKLHSVIDDFLLQFASISLELTSTQLSRVIGSDIDSDNNNDDPTMFGIQKSYPMTPVANESNVNKSELLTMKYLTRLVQDMSKYSNLIIIASATTFIYASVSMVFDAIAADSNNNINEYEHGMVFTSLLLIDNTINRLCLIFQFGFASKYYAKYGVCMCGHRILIKKYLNVINNRNQSNVSKRNQLERVVTPPLDAKMVIQKSADLLA